MVQDWGPPHVTETGSTSKTFLNYSADASGATVVSPETDHSGVFFVKIDKNDVPSQYWNNLPIVLTSGSNTTNVTANLVSGADYLITGPLIALYPGASASFASLTPISLASGLLLQVSMPAIATQGKKARGVLPPFVGEAGAVPMDDHLKIISDPFSWKEAGKPKKGLGYPKATLNGHVRDTDIADIIPKHDIFYLFAHGIVDNTKSTPATTISNPIAAGFRAVQIFTDSFGLDSRDYTLTPNDISTVLDTGHEYKLVFLNGCASFDNENDKMVEFTNAFQTDYYCGWLYPVTGVSASLAAKRFLWALDRTDSVIAAAKGLWAAHPTARMNYGGGGDLKPARVPLRVNENVSVPVHLDLKR